MQQQLRDVAFVLFINTASGSKVGRDYLSIEAEEINFRVINKPSVHIFFYDLFDANDRKKGLATVLRYQTEYDMRVIICGGDGSVLWVVQEVIDAGIDLERIIFGIIPIGTGNDFSRSLGWTTTTAFSDTNLGGLKGIVKEWMRASIRKYDIWDLELDLHEGGDIRRIKNRREVIVEDKLLHRSFSNYFSLGIDARIGYSFDRRRTKNKLANLICYGCIGLWKWLTGRSARMDELLHSMEEGNESQTIQQQLEKDDEELEVTGDRLPPLAQMAAETPAPAALNEDHKQVIFHTDKGRMSCNTDQFGQQNTLKPGFKNLLALNSTSFMAGAMNIWDSRKEAVLNAGERSFAKQDFGDGMLEFVSFRSEFQMGLERYVSGRSSRLAQGPGPYVLNFRKALQPTETYLQIDGEFYRIRNPKSLRVCRTTKIAGSQINVMVRNP